MKRKKNIYMYSVFCVSAWRGDRLWTSGVCVWVWGPPSASSERCSTNGRWKLHTPVWLHRWTRVFQLEVLESFAVPENSQVQEPLFKLKDTERTTGTSLPISEDATSFSSCFGGFDLSSWVTPYSWIWECPQAFFHGEVNFVYRDVYLVLNNLKMYVFYPSYSMFFSLFDFCYVFWASVIACPLCI